MPSHHRLTARRTAATISTLALALGLAACGGDDSTDPSGPPGTSIEQPELPGTGDNSGDKELSSEFPDDIPVPDDHAVVTQGYRGGGATVVYTTDMDFDALFDLYAQGLPAQGWDAGEHGDGIPDDPSPVRTEFDLTKDNFRLTVRITEEAQGFSVMINRVDQG